MDELRNMARYPIELVLGSVAAMFLVFTLDLLDVGKPVQLLCGAVAIAISLFMHRRVVSALAARDRPDP